MFGWKMGKPLLEMCESKDRDESDCGALVWESEKNECGVSGFVGSRGGHALYRIQKDSEYTHVYPRGHPNAGQYRLRTALPGVCCNDPECVSNSSAILKCHAEKQFIGWWFKCCKASGVFERNVVNWELKWKEVPSSALIKCSNMCGSEYCGFVGDVRVFSIGLPYTNDMEDHENQILRGGLPGIETYFPSHTRQEYGNLNDLMDVADVALQKWVGGMKLGWKT